MFGIFFVDAVLLLLCVGLIGVWLSDVRTPRWHVASSVLALAFLSLSKFSLGIFCIVGIGVVACSLLARGHAVRPAALAMGFAAAMVEGTARSLRLRPEPGPIANLNWDWSYVSSVQFHEE